MAVLLGLLILKSILVIFAQTKNGTEGYMQSSLFMNEVVTKGYASYASLLGSSITSEKGSTQSGKVSFHHTETTQIADATSGRAAGNQGTDRYLGPIDHNISRVNINDCAHHIDYNITLPTSYNLTRELWIHPDEMEMPFVACVTTSYIPEGYHLNLTIDQLKGTFDGNFKLTLSEVDNESKLPHPVVIDELLLKNASVSLMFTNPARIRFEAIAPYRQLILKIHYLIHKGPYVRDLPVYTVSSTVSYVTSPGFNDNQNYPNNFDGEFILNIREHESIILSFSHNMVGDFGCEDDYLWLITIPDNQKHVQCLNPTRTIVQVFHSSLSVYFHTDKKGTRHGFKMIFTVVPRYEIPQNFPSSDFNCSAPYFYLIRPFLTCNMLNECENGEDERDCLHHSKECGDGLYDTGTKCYRLVRVRRHLSWTDANIDCRRHGQNLVTFATSDEYDQYIQFLRTAKLSSTSTFVGLQTVSWTQAVSVAALYKNAWQWANGLPAFLTRGNGYQYIPICAAFPHTSTILQAVPCGKARYRQYVCEFEKQSSNSQTETVLYMGDGWLTDSKSVPKIRQVLCASGHVTRDFLACDPKAECIAPNHLMTCQTHFGEMPMFICRKERALLHYTLVCDHMQHCSDNSDEDFCWHPPCLTEFGHMKCLNGQCIREHKRCDGQLDCYDGSDESCHIDLHDRDTLTLTFPPGSVYFDSKGGYTVEPLNSSHCPPTHFMCPRYYCLPVYLRCNGIKDCPGREDETGCDIYTCPGFYRCRGSKVCLHADNVCDGVPQCPEQDDELLCDLSCPDQCHCQGLAFVCNTNFSASSYPALRYLDASGSGMTPDDLTDNLYLIHLRLSNCGISSVPLNMTLPNLWELHLSWNRLTYLDMYPFGSLMNLRVLILAGNPLTEIIHSAPSELGVIKLSTIDLSYSNLIVFNASSLKKSPELRSLNISNSKVTIITDEGFRFIPELELFDSRGSALRYFPSDLLRDLTFLKSVHVDNYKLCCKSMLPPNFILKNCHTKQDIFASCDRLVSSNTYRVVLWLFASLSIIGNIGSFAARLYLKRKEKAQGSMVVFITNLSVAHFLMGIYLAVICVADLVLHGKYLLHDDGWKSSTACKIAGFLSLLSNEVSVLIVCLITLDCFLILRFPVSRIRFKRTSALISCGVVWFVGVVLAAVPLLPMTSHWEFYSQTSICAPLPVANGHAFHGYDYHFSVVILFNIIICVPIAVEQAIVYWSTCANPISSSSNNQASESAVARRLNTIVISNFLCMFSVGLVGVLSAAGTLIPREFGVVIAIFVLPFNSALNPFFYVLNVVKEKRKQAQEALLLERLRRLRQPDKAKNTPRTQQN